MDDNTFTPEQQKAEDYIDDRARRGSDGKFRWIYEMNLFTELTVFFLVWKIFFFILIGIFAVTTVVDMIEWVNYFPERFLDSLRVFGWFLLGMTVVVTLGYLLYAAIMGGKYVVKFELDEAGVLHQQIESQAKKAKRIGQATALLGAARGSMTTVGVGLTSQRSEMYSDFSRVRRVKTYKRRRLIKVNGVLQHNQVLTHPDDFDFVADFIRAHCPNLKK
jgi:hypothetical protein